MKENRIKKTYRLEKETTENIEFLQKQLNKSQSDIIGIAIQELVYNQMSKITGIPRRKMEEM